MNHFLSDPANYIKIYILFSLLWCVFFYVDKKRNRYLLVILLLSLCCEIVTSIFSNSPIIKHVNINTYFVLLDLLWFLIFYEISHNKKRIVVTLIFYLVVCIINLEFIESGINFNLFIVGALLYLVLFIMENFHQLNIENLSFFQSNTYLLLFCPVLFFLGLSFILGFKSPTLYTTKMCFNLNVYQLINYPINIIYYALMNLYMFRENRNSYV